MLDSCFRLAHVMRHTPLLLALVFSVLVFVPGQAQADCANPVTLLAPTTVTEPFDGNDCYEVAIASDGVLTVTLTGSDGIVAFDGFGTLPPESFLNGFGTAATDAAFFSAGDTVHISVFSFQSPPADSYTLSIEFEETSIDPDVQLIAAVLPSGRSGQVGNLLTAFATVINVGTHTGVGCGITPVTSVPADFFYRPNGGGTAFPFPANSPLDIDRFGGREDLIFGFTSTGDFPPTDIELEFSCNNSMPAPVTSGLNTFLMSASTTPVADVVARAATLSRDGLVRLSEESGSGLFAAAATNLGPSTVITAIVAPTDASLPATLSLCQTDAITGVCINPVTPTTNTINLTIDTDGVATFGAFVTASESVPFDPAGNRLVLRFEDAGGMVRGSTSVAVATGEFFF